MRVLSANNAIDVQTQLTMSKMTDKMKSILATRVDITSGEVDALVEELNKAQEN